MKIQDPRHANRCKSILGRVFIIPKELCVSEHIKSNNYEELPIDRHINLRAVREDEAGALFERTDDSREYLAEYLPWVHKTTSPADSLDFIRSIQQERAEGSQYGFGIYYDDRLVGHISLMHLSDGQKPEIGYWIDQNSSGRGITTKAAGRVTQFGFETLKLQEILVKAAVTNIASNKVAQKLGYELSGTEKSDNGTEINVWRKINEQQ